MIDDDHQRTGEGLDHVAAQLRAADLAARDLSRAIGGSLRTAMDRAMEGGHRFTDVLRSLATDLARASLSEAVRPVAAAMGAGAGGLLSGAMQGLAAHAVAGLGGSVRAFARGGVVDGPTGFAMADGLGVMGEAGPEAILPLARGADGRLGVRGGTGVQVTLNLATPDPESFARSRTQVAAALARAVARGTARL